MQKIFHATKFLLIVVLAFGIARCNQKSKASVTTDDAIAVKVQPVTTTAYAPVIRYSGTTASTSEAKLSFKIAGIISKIYVKEGDRVVKGQLLATLDLTEINAQVQQATQGAEKAQRDVNRIRNLYNDTVASLEQLQNVSTQLDVAKENVRIARFNQQFAQIHATENGIVLKKLMNEGELASTGSAVFFISGNASNDWVVRFGVADKDWAVLNKGDKATVTIDAYPGKTFTGIITEIAAGADVASGTYEVEVKVLPGTARFATGLFATVQLQPAGDQTITLIPIEALAEANNKTGYVYAVNADQKTVTKYPVTIAFLEKDKVAISKGLENVPAVITDGVGYLTEKAIVKIIR
jgi:multidrug efflux system membrane fusion protein